MIEVEQTGGRMDKRADGHWSVGWDDILCLNKLGHWRSIVVVRKEDMILQMFSLLTTKVSQTLSLLKIVFLKINTESSLSLIVFQLCK